MQIGGTSLLRLLVLPVLLSLIEGERNILSILDAVRYDLPKLGAYGLPREKHHARMVAVSE